MWVRIQEFSFHAEDADRVIAHVRDTTVSRFTGDSYRGSRLLVDRSGGTALEVSYWHDEQGARGRSSDHVETLPTPREPTTTHVPGCSVLRTRCYELSVDAG